MDYTKYVAKRVKKIDVSTIRFFFDMVNEVKDVISLCIGEPDFTTPGHINEAAIEALNRGETFYTSNAGLMELRKEVSKYLSRRFDLVYSPEDEIIITTGASQAIDVALRTLIEVGDEVLVPEPSFIAYKPCTILSEGKAVAVPTYIEDGFALRPEVLERYITPRSKALILLYPNNPTGAVMTKDQLEKIAVIVKKHDLIVISDEIYNELTYGVKHVPFASITDMWKRTVTIGGLSKSYAMTGWRLGYLLSPKGLTSELYKVHQYNVTCAASMCQHAAVEALKNGDRDIERMREEYDRRRRYTVDALRQIGLECFEPRGAFYTFASIKNTGLTSEIFCKRLLHEAKVAVVPGNAFGESGEGYIRISYATSMENLNIAMERIKKFNELL
ncbi:MAG: aminotransferase class I/II-fold pyridoxal phosphate-dependent enzyme [Thermoanaerobacterales bacterium]|nr:aminotransferase class I/II-fold pyridoxal phosphate-dependent enzyme [Thermoanaerobacterales bacterium]